MEQLKTQRHDTMTFGELVDGIGAKIGVGFVEDGYYWTQLFVG